MAELRLAGKGRTPSDCSPLTLLAGDQAYRIEVDVSIEGGCEAGLLLFYNRRLYAGLGIGAKGLVMHRYGLQRPRNTPPVSSLRIAITNDRNIVTLHTSADKGVNWRKFDVQMEVSGYHHNVAYDFLSLRPGALCRRIRGQRILPISRYRALP
jgi:xylan 1,4-beta-xylosidase